jgi:hypothetical protein
MEAGYRHEMAADGEDLLMRRWLLGAIAVLLALALAGCGGGGHKSSGGSQAVSGQAIAAAAVKSARAGSVEADFEIAGAGVNGSGSGVFNTGASRTGQLSMKVSVNGVAVPIDSVVTGNVLYMRSSLFTRFGVSGGKQWIKVDLGKLAQQQGVDLSSLANANPTPASALEYLRGATHVRKVGTDSIQGADATHYKVSVDLERAAARSSGSERRSLRRLMQASGVKKLPVDVWIDAKGYLRKVVYAQPAWNGVAVRVAMELHDYGPPVTVKPPPASSVTDVSKALGGG